MSDYRLRLYTRPHKLGGPWRQFPAWRQHEGMTAGEVLQWYWEESVPWIEKTVEECGRGKSIDKPIVFGGDIEAFVSDVPPPDYLLTGIAN